MYRSFVETGNDNCIHTDSNGDMDFHHRFQWPPIPKQMVKIYHGSNQW
jgi:hypothetical protein